MDGDELINEVNHLIVDDLVVVGGCGVGDGYLNLEWGGFEDEPILYHLWPFWNLDNLDGHALEDRILDFDEDEDGVEDLRILL